MLFVCCRTNNNNLYICRAGCVEGGVVVGRLGDLQPLGQQHQPGTFEKKFLSPNFFFFFKPNKKRMYTWKEKKKKTNPLFIEYPESFHYLPWCVGTSGPQHTRDERAESMTISILPRGKEKKSISWALAFDLFSSCSPHHRVSLQRVGCGIESQGPPYSTAQTQDDDLPVSPRGPVLPQFRGQSFLNK